MIDSDHISPDGALRFLVRSPDGDITMGFDGFGWHTHGDLLAAMPSESPEKAAEHFVAMLTAGELIIAISKVSGTTRDIWITADPAADLRYCPAAETLEFRLWDGTKILP